MTNLEYSFHSFRVGCGYVEHSEMSDKSSGEWVSATAGRRARTRQHHVNDILPIQLISIVNTTKV